MRLIRLNRSPEGEGGGATETTDATITKLSADVEALTANNQKLLGEMNSVRSLNSDILGAFGVDANGSAAEKLGAKRAPKHQRKLNFLVYNQLLKLLNLLWLKLLTHKEKQHRQKISWELREKFGSN